jgi:glycosyltransferase involved in cell wall biosynthesis
VSAPISTVAITSNTAWYVFNFRGGLIKLLQSRGYRVVVFAPCDEYASRFQDLGCEYFEIKMQNAGVNPVKDFSIVLQYFKLLRKIKPDVFLTYTPKANIYGAIAAKLADIPVITNVSGLGRAFINPNWITFIVRLLYKFAFKFPAKIFFQNSDDRNFFLKYGLVRERQAGVLPGSGVDLKFFQSQFFQKKPGEFVFLLVARMLWDKGVGEFVGAARNVKKNHHEARFQLLGFLDVDNPSAISRVQMSEWVDEGIIEYLGSTDNVRDYFSRADCVVLPSYREGTPKTLLEAASMGLPVITTDATGCRDTIDDEVTGFMCKVKDIDSLAECMLKVLNLSGAELKKMGMAGREKMQRQFDEKIVFDAYLASIDTVSKNN